MPNPFPDIKKEVQRQEKEYLKGLTGREREVYDYFKSIGEQVTHNINEGENAMTSSNLPQLAKNRTEREQNDVLQKMVENEMDDILADSSKSRLEQVLKISEASQKYQSGNCMQKAFVGMEQALEAFHSGGATNANSTPDIDVYYYEYPNDPNDNLGHFFFVAGNSGDKDLINGEQSPSATIIYPWAQNTFPAATLKNFKGTDADGIYSGSLNRYLSIHNNWQVESILDSQGMQADEASTNYTYTLISQLDQKARDRARSELEQAPQDERKRKFSDDLEERSSYSGHEQASKKAKSNIERS